MKEQQGKVCNKCKQWKPLEEYNKQKRGKFGRRSTCRECQKEYNKQWRGNNSEHIKEYRENNREKLNESKRKWAQNNPEYFKIYSNSEQQKQYREQYYKDNAEHLKEYNKQYRQDNAERIKGYEKQYRKDNAERIKGYHKQYYKDNAEHIKQYRKDNAEHLKEYNKQWHDDIKENNLKYISSIVGQINPVMKDLPVYGYIYKFENVKTGHVYIGQTIKPLKIRYGQEGGIIKSWIKERKEKQNQKFIEELIEEDFVVTEVLDVAFCQYHLDKLEVCYIDKYGSYNNGYNNTAGNHITDDGFEEFIEMLQRYNIEFIDGKIVKKAN